MAIWIKHSTYATGVWLPFTRPGELGRQVADLSVRTECVEIISHDRLGLKVPGSDHNLHASRSAIVQNFFDVVESSDVQSCLNLPPCV
jgi:hypothetical protein